MEELTEYWEQYPPAHIVLGSAHLKDFGKRSRRKLEKQAGDQRRAFTSEVLKIGGGVKPLSQMPAQIRELLKKNG